MLNLYRSRIESRLQHAIERMGEKNRLRDACEYALLGGGKRLRPILVQMVAETLKNDLDVMEAALSVEFFHTASLIADDLPCMDNDHERRNRPSLHKAFDESTAILASYTLIAEGYGGIVRNSQLMKKNGDRICALCLEAATRCAGIKGATGGHFFDLNPPDQSMETVQKIMMQKTVTLFEISFVFGWLFGGGDLDRLDRVRKCAHHLGMAFQIADDLQDVTQKNGINLALACGVEKASRIFEEEMDGFEVSLKELDLWTQPFKKVVDWFRKCDKIT